MKRTDSRTVQIFIIPQERDALKLLAQKHGALKSVGALWAPSVTRLIRAVARGELTISGQVAEPDKD
jgi:hypothetical protein